MHPTHTVKSFVTNRIMIHVSAVCHLLLVRLRPILYDYTHSSISLYQALYLPSRRLAWPAGLRLLHLHGLLFFSRWLSRPTELCCREGPDGGTAPLGRNPRKLLGAPPFTSGRPLNGCKPPLDEAWQPLGCIRSTRRSTSSRDGRQRSCSRGRRLLLLLRQQQLRTMRRRGRMMNDGR